MSDYPKADYYRLSPNEDGTENLVMGWNIQPDEALRLIKGLYRQQSADPTPRY